MSERRQRLIKTHNPSKPDSPRPLRFVVACGGTGGHVFPGVAAAKALKAQGNEVALILSGRAVEGERPDGWDGPVILVPCRPPRWGNPLHAASSLFSLARAFSLALVRIRRFRPQALLAMGSYTSVPPVLAARALHVPVVLHEANAIPGVAVSRLCHLASAVCIAFDEAAAHLPASTTTINTGMPVRGGIAGAAPGRFANPSRFTILVMGGSQGAQKLNKIVADSVALLDRDPAEADALRFIHLAGAKNEDAVRASYSQVHSIPVEVIGFSNEMGSLYAASQFCISRAGSSSCFELALCGLPALLVPLPGLARDHQAANAKAMHTGGACDFELQPELTPEKLAAHIRSIRADSAKRASMRAALLARARPDAAEALGRVARRVATAKNSGQKPS